MVFQGILGGLTVTELLRFDIVTAHLGTGLLFFSLLLSIGIGLTSLAPPSSTEAAPEPSPVSPYLPWVGTVATVTIYGQSILGALLASQWALHLCFGESELCGVMNAHLFGILPAVTATPCCRDRHLESPIEDYRAATAVLFSQYSLVAQLGVGFATYKLHLQVEPLTVTHQAIGAALLGTLLSFTVLAWRLRFKSFSVISP